MPTNQEIEQYYFEQFAKVYPLPDGEVRFCDKPDVRIVGERRTIGIEITNSYHLDGSDRSSEQVQRRWRATEVAEAQRLYLEGGGKSIQLTLGFDPKHPLTRSGDLARRLARLGKSVEDRANGPIPWPERAFLPEINFAYLYTVQSDNPMPDTWRVSMPFPERTICPERTRKIVADKESKVKDFAPCDEYWLLIVVDFANQAQDQNLSWDDPPLESSAFRRIIAYRTVMDQVVELTRPRYPARSSLIPSSSRIFARCITILGVCPPGRFAHAFTVFRSIVCDVLARKTWTSKTVDIIGSSGTPSAWNFATASATASCKELASTNVECPTPSGSV